MTNNRETTPAPLELLDELLFVDHDSTEWPYMWGQLDDPAAYCPETGEVWQYMGSFRKAGRYVHEMRHRHHPLTRRREIRLIPASDAQMERLYAVARELAARQAAPRPEAEILAEVEESWARMVEGGR